MKVAHFIKDRKTLCGRHNPWVKGLIFTTDPKRVTCIPCKEKLVKRGTPLST